MQFSIGRRSDHFDVFLSYTRSDTEGWCALIHSELNRQLAPQMWSVFKDNANTQPGQKDWRKRLEKLVKNCRVFIVLIGEDWHSSRVDHLFDQENYVRWEILRALESDDKVIIPLILNGKNAPELSGLPKDIQPVLQNHQACFMSGDSEKLALEVGELVKHISGTKAAKSSIDENLDQKISTLNRHIEFDRIFTAYRNNHSRVFALAGDYKDCYESFLYRCQIELGKDNRHDTSSAGIKIHPLEWRAFSDLPSATSQKNKLLEQVCDSLSLPKNEIQLRKYFSDNSQAMVFYSVCDKPKSAEVCVDWLNYWKSLLENNNQQSAIAILVFNRGWSLTRHRKQIHSSAALSELPLLTDGLGRIEQAHVKEFHGSHLNHIEVDAFHDLISKHYRWSALAKLLPQLQPSCRKIRTVLKPYIS